MASSERKPTCIIVLGMAGSGKTTFVQGLTKYLTDCHSSTYVINLDPGCVDVPYPVKIDIRDTVNYKDVMKHYGLGPNGAIVTCLNLFATKFTDVMNLLEKRAEDTEYVIIDTPGQIEVFTWSASGQVITETLASVYPTVIVYVTDSARCVSPVTFMSNMTYACSIMFKTRLPLILALNKKDVVDPSFAIKWMRDFESFLAEVDANSESIGYNARLTYSLGLALDDFYSNLRAVPVSALEHSGFDSMVQALEDAKIEYETDYKVAYENLRKDKEEEDKKKAEMGLGKAKADMKGEMERETGMYLKCHGADNESTDEEREDLDEQDYEEKGEEEGFKTFLKMHVQKEQSKQDTTKGSK